MLSQWQKGAASFDARSLGGQLAVKAFDFDFSEVDKYPEGGVDCDLGVFYNGKKHAAIVAPKGGYVFEYDAENAKLIVYVVGEDTGDAVPGALAEVEDETDLSSLGKVSILSWGM